MKKMKLKRKVLGIVSVLMLTVGVLYPIVAHPKETNAWVCDSRNVMICGVADRKDLANKIKNGDGTHTDIKTIFNGIGIYPDDILSSDAKGGIVKKDGTVWVGSQQVASGAIVGQRGTKNIEGANTPWDGLNWAYTQYIYDSEVQQAGAYVYMRNGKFLYAVLVSCGNPVLTSLNGIPPHLTIAKTVRNATKNPEGAFEENVNAKMNEVVEFKVKVYNDAQVTTEDVNIGDYLPTGLVLESGSAKVITRGLVNGSWQNVEVKYSDAEVAAGKNIGNVQPGSDAYLIFKAKVKASTEGSSCKVLENKGYADAGQTNPITDKATVTVCASPTGPQTIPEEPVQPEVTPSPVAGKLPVSGPVEAAAGVFGTGALGYTGYLWRRSRKNLFKALKKS